MNKIKWLAVILTLTAQLLQAQAFNFSPEAADIYQNGMNAMRMRRLTVAREQFKEIIEKYPDDIHASMARRQIVSVMRDMKEFDQAIALLQEILEKDKSADNQRFAQEEILDILFEIQRFKQGVDLIEQWRKVNPNDVLLSRNLAKFYLQIGKKDEAWLLLESVLEKNAAPDAFRDLLELAMRSDEVNKLLQTLEGRRAVYRSNEYADYVSDCYLALGKKDKAIEILREVENLPNHLMLQRKLADLLIGVGEYEEAFNFLTMSLKIAPEDWNAIKKMGHCRFMQKKTDEAIALWRQPLQQTHMRRQDFYQDLTTVLIEHQLYEESLKVFYEARIALQQVTLFSEEVASVLDALGRKNEALEEFINVFVAGIYRSEVFERLYKEYEEGFDLEKRLVEIQNTGFNAAILQALMELYFRQADTAKVDKILDLVISATGSLDEIFYERLNQEALLSPVEFHFVLTRKVIQQKIDSTLALRLASLLLEMGALDDMWQQQAFTEAVSVAQQKNVADADLKSALLVKLAEYTFGNLNDLNRAHGFLDAILQSELLKAAPLKGLTAGILKARLLIYQEKYSQAADLLSESEKIIAQANSDIFAADPISESDFLAQVILEKARMATHSGDHQKALEELKNMVENLPESEWVNEALEMANYIMRRSIGNFDLLQRSLKAERLLHGGKYSDAINELETAVSANASATALVEEIQAEIIGLRKHIIDPDKMLILVDDYAKKFPKSYKTADLWELKWRIMKKASAPEAEIREHLQTFIDHFPSDLRSGRFKKLIARKASHGKAEQGESE